MHYDMVIIGGGLVGTIAALMLRQKTDYSILLLDASVMPAGSRAPNFSGTNNVGLPQNKIHTNSKVSVAEKLGSRLPAGMTAITPPEQIPSKLDTRTLALNYTSIETLKTLGLWQEIAHEASPIHKVHISEQGAFGSCLLSCQDVGYPHLGAVIEINRLYETCLKALAQDHNIHHQTGVTVSQLEFIDNHWRILSQKNQQEETIQAPRVILADGTQSSLRAKLNIDCDFFDYQQSAVVAIATTTLPHQQVAYERFCGASTLAVLPLSDERIGTVLTAPQDQIEELLALSDQAYLEKLQQLFGYRLGKFVQLGKRQSYPLQLRIAHTFVRNNLVLLGNTAHTLNPLGAQGFNLGLKGIKDYVDTLACNASLNDFALRQHERAEQLKKFTHQTLNLFSSEALITQCARRSALNILQHTFSLKNRFTRRMMGFQSQPFPGV